MKLGIKLALLLLALSTIPVLVSSYLGYMTARDSLTATVMNQLTGIRRSKGSEVESYFRTAFNEIRTMGESSLIVTAMGEFRNAFAKLEGPEIPSRLQDPVIRYYREGYLPELSRFMDLRPQFEQYLPGGSGPYYLQYHYIVNNPHPIGKKYYLDQASDGSEYSKIHLRYHQELRKFVERFGYVDIFLIDHETGQIFYTMLKEPDFVTNLRSGPYRSTALARAFENCRTAGRLAIADFEAYEPSLGQPSAFVCSPIVKDGQRIGVLALQLSNHEIDNVVSGNQGWVRDGLGRTGDSGIVGPDYLMRSTSRGFIEDPERHLARLGARNVPYKTLMRMKAYNSTSLLQEVRLPSVEAALAGEEGTRLQIGSAGGRTLVSYGPLNIEGLHWTIASRMDENEALATVEQLRQRLRRLTLLVLALTVVLVLLTSHWTLKPVNALVAATRRLAAGDLSARVPVTSKDELGHLSDTFNAMAGSIQQQTEEIQQKNRENEALLLNILPGPIADRLKSGESTIADHFAEVTVLFADIVGFTTMSNGRTPTEVVDLLNDLFRRFDAIAQRFGVEKIKTIGDAYMAVTGLPIQCDDHVQRMADMALEMTAAMHRFSRDRDVDFSLRIGINSGPVVAGVIGATKFIYDLWGDTVNTASRMESHGVAGSVQVTRRVYEQLKDEYEFEPRGEIEVKGKGRMTVWLLRGRLAMQAATR
jgi:class 3 adenylate cyclase